MALYLDDQARTYLERLIKKQVLANSFDFIAKRIEGMLESDRERLEKIANCKHVHGEYSGRKTCCVKCGGWLEGDGEEWTLKETT